MANNRLSIFPYLLLLIIMAGIGYYGYTNYEVLTAKKTMITNNLALTSTLEKDLKSAEADYKTAQKEAAVNNQNQLNALAYIFPAKEDITNLTREFDNFFTKNNFSNNPLFLSNLTYGAPINNEDWDYTILPVKMTIQSSEPNFYKTLDYFENSGSFQNQLRLMSIKTININFHETGASINPENTPEIKLIDYTIDLSAYFKKQIEKK